MAATLHVAVFRVRRVLHIWLVTRKDPVLWLIEVCLSCWDVVSGQSIGTTHCCLPRPAANISSDSSCRCHLHQILFVSNLFGTKNNKPYESHRLSTLCMTCRAKSLAQHLVCCFCSWFTTRVACVRTKSVMVATRSDILQGNSNTTLNTIYQQVSPRVRKTEGCMIVPYMVFAAKTKCL